MSTPNQGAPASASDAVVWKPGQHGYARETTVLEDEHQIVEVGVSPHGRIDLIVHRATDGGGFDDLTAHLTQKTAALVVAALTEAGASLAPPAVVPESVREGLADAMLSHEHPSSHSRGYLVPFAEQDPSVRRHWLSKADLALSYLATPSERADTPPAGGGAVEGWVADEPTPEMYAAARDWSRGKYGTPIGNEAARGCWQAMLWRAPVDLCALAAAPAAPDPAAGGGRETAPATKAECVTLTGAIRKEFGKLADAYGDVADDLDDTCDRVVDVVLEFLAVRELPRPILSAPTEAGAPWSEHSPQEIVRRTRCMADETRDAVVWRDCCDLILERLGIFPEPTPATAGAEGGPHADR